MKSHTTKRKWPKRVISLLLEASDWLEEESLRYMTKAKILSRIAILEQMYDLTPIKQSKKGKKII